MINSDFSPECQNRSIESKIVASLERVSQAFRVLLWEESKAYSLSPIQVQILIFILYHSNEKCNVSYLAKEFNMTKATISETIKTLEQKNLIIKDYDQSDARRYVINLTPEGKDSANKTSLFTEQLCSPIKQLQQEDKERLFSSLLQIISYLNRSGVINIQRMCMSCSYYQPVSNGQEHYCQLINQKLFIADLKIDCPEFKLR